MLRSNLFLIGILIAGAGTAQETNDPAAAAPVVYDQAAPTDWANGTYGTDENPVRCSDTEATDIDDDVADVAVDAESDEYADDAPVYGDATEYYPGVSLFADDYWVPGFGLGWPYYSYAPFAYGWPYYGFGFASWGWGWGWPGYGFAWWGGHHHHHDHHHGWHDHQHYASHAYPGPYRYLGHGRYANRVRATSGERTAVRADRGSARATSLATMQRTSGVRTGLSTPRRAVLPSASYYATARRSEVAPRGISVNRPAASSSRSAAMVDRAGVGRYNRADHAVTTRTQAQRHAVTSLPSRGYAPSNNHRERATYPASHGYAVHSRSPPSYSPPRYAIPNRGYPGASRAPSHNAPGVATRSAAGPSVPHGGGGSPAGVSVRGGTHGGSATPYRH